MTTVMQKRQQYRPTTYVMKLKNEVPGLEIYIVDRKIGHKVFFMAMGWTSSRQIKPFDKWYNDAKSREKGVRNILANAIESYQNLKERQHGSNQPHTFKVGDILEGSWGYDQTNADTQSFPGKPD